MLEIADYNIDDSDVYDILENRDVTGKRTGKVADKEPRVSPAERTVYVDYMSTVIDRRWKIVVQGETTAMNIVQ